MNLSTKYSSSEIEDRWYQHWLSRKYFSSTPDERTPFSIVIPPPNVTGVLHMGHMLNNTIQDALIRRARLQDKNACWVPGTDHASIATEAKVVRWLREEKGLKKSDLTREEFLDYAYQWKDKYGGIILNQLQKLGASCDWDRTAFTMDPIRSDGVLRSFVDLYNRGKLYRGLRMINWDPEAKTVLSNEEVIYNEENAQLFHLKYHLENDPEIFIVIATQRPETIMADAAVAVHPEDERFKLFHGKKVCIPLTGRAIPIIQDDYVDREFGTGALKVTPAHDQNDYELGKKHSLEVIDILNEDGTLNEKAELFIGLDRFEARKRIKKELDEKGFLVKLEDYRTNIGRSERTNAVVEPRLSLQWFVDMKSLAGPALEHVMNDDIMFQPASFKNTYRHWLENIRDWCISRQLWWGHQIPAWFVGEEVFVALTVEEALEQAKTKTGNYRLTIADLKRDEDVLDTWFSSWLWPITVFDGFNPESKDFAYYYPTSVLVTGWDIIFLWVARMVMAGYEWKQELPFKTVYFTGMVRDKQRRKMSKSLGNSPDALKLIEDFGADGVRFGVLASSPAGGDLLFDEKLCEQGRNFCNKLWNALRLVKGWPLEEVHHDPAQAQANEFAIRWFAEHSRQVFRQVEELNAQFRLSEALMTLYTFIWDDFCSWYLEIIKPGFGEAIDEATYSQTLNFFEQLMVQLHPFMPFITEELWHQLKERVPGEDCTIAHRVYSQWKMEAVLQDPIQQYKTIQEIVTRIREVRNSKQLKPKEKLVLKMKASAGAQTFLMEQGIPETLEKLSGTMELALVKEAPEGSIALLSGTEEFYLQVPIVLDVEEERARMTKELDYYRGFKDSVMKKLSNEKFVSSAPAAVVDSERKKLEDAEARITILEDGLGRL
jgi:valyl-tRNA synthetase